MKLEIKLLASDKNRIIGFVGGEKPFGLQGQRAVLQASGKFAIILPYSRANFLYSEIARKFTGDFLGVVTTDSYTKAIQEFFNSELPQQPAVIKPEMQLLDTQLQFIRFFNSVVIPDGNVFGWKNRYSGVFNASEPGTGKTLSAVSALSNIYAMRVLIVAPATLTYQWKDEVNRYLVVPPVSVAVANMPGKDRLTVLEETARIPYLYVFVSYETFRINVEQFMSQKWDAVVFDECIRLMNSGASITKAMLEFINPAINPNTPKIAIGLNGTPISKSAADLYNQLWATRCPRIEEWEATDFRDKFANKKQIFVAGRNMTVYEGIREAYTLANLLAPNYFRIGKDWSILPEKLYQTVNLRMTEEEASIYEQIEASGSSLTPGKSTLDLRRDEAKIEAMRQLREKAFSSGYPDESFVEYLDAGIGEDDFTIDETLDIATQAALLRAARQNRMIRLQRLTSGYENVVELGGKRTLRPILAAKRNWCVEYCKENPTQSIIIFCKFNAEVYDTCEALIAEGIFAEYCTGRDDAASIADKKARFQECETQVLVCQISKMFEGHNLQRCDTMIYYSQSFRLVHREQSESRAHRLGRKEPVQYIDLLLSFPDGGQTIDHHIKHNIVDRKRNVLEALSVNTVKHTADAKLMAIAQKLADMFPSMKQKLAEIMAEGETAIPVFDGDSDKDITDETETEEVIL